MLGPKPVIVITAAGDGALLRGGAQVPLNFVEPPLDHVLNFIGLSLPTWVRVGYEKFGDERLARALSAAEARIDDLACSSCRPAGELRAAMKGRFRTSSRPNPELLCRVENRGSTSTVVV